MTELDHITVAAHSLEQGLAYIRETLGIDMPYGGEHPRMGTHNHLLRLGDSLFLELIAINPASAPPDRARWFQLDDPALQQQLIHKPRLLTWVVRTQDIAATLQGSEVALGTVVSMTRGNLHWLITIPDDGMMPGAGMMPALIQWPEGPHPASAMKDLGCSLERLEAMHPEPASFERALASIGAERHIRVRQAEPGVQPRLLAHIRTPLGVRALG